MLNARAGLRSGTINEFNTTGSPAPGISGLNTIRFQTGPVPLETMKSSRGSESDVKGYSGATTTVGHGGYDDPAVNVSDHLQAKPVLRSAYVQVYVERETQVSAV